MSLKTKLLTLGGFWAFFAFGFIDNLKGPLLPEMVRSGQLDYAQSGTLVLASYLGFILATLSSGLLADRLSNRLVLWLSGLCISVGAIGIMVGTSYGVWLVNMFIVGLGLGAIELGANGLMIQLHSAARGRFLNLLSVFHGCGSLIVPLAAAALIESHWNWPVIYAAGASLACPLLLIFWPTRAHDTFEAQLKTAHEQATNTTLSPVSLWSSGFTPIMWAYYVLIAAYVAVELSIGTWMMEYLQKNHELSVETSSQYLSGFFVLLMLGRLLGAGFVERFDYLIVVACALLATAACIAAALFLEDRWIMLLPVSGLCMSIVFPTVTAAVSKLHPHGTGAIMGLLFAFGGVGGAAGPWLVGVISQRVGLQTGLATTLVFDAVALLALAVVHRSAWRARSPFAPRK